MDYFSKTLIGTHGQELILSVLPFLQHTSSVVELVMLLCSQVSFGSNTNKYIGIISYFVSYSYSYNAATSVHTCF